MVCVSVYHNHTHKLQLDLESVLRGVFKYILVTVAFCTISACSLPEGQEVEGVYAHEDGQMRYLVRLRENGHFDQLVCSDDEALFIGGGVWNLTNMSSVELIEFTGYAYVNDAGRFVRSPGVVASELNWLPFRGIGFAFPFSDMGLYLPYRGEVEQWQCANF